MTYHTPIPAGIEIIARIPRIILAVKNRCRAVLCKPLFSFLHLLLAHPEALAKPHDGCAADLHGNEIDQHCSCRRAKRASRCQAKHVLSPSPFFCAVNPTRGKTTSLGIGGKITSKKAAANTAGYQYSAIRPVYGVKHAAKVPGCRQHDNNGSMHFLLHEGGGNMCTSPSPRRACLVINTIDALCLFDLQEHLRKASPWRR